MGLEQVNFPDSFDGKADRYLLEQSFLEIRGRVEELGANTTEDLSALIKTASDREKEQQLILLKNEAKRLTEGTLNKISEQLGSNPGGWYEDKETGDQYYIKFYRNPNQARAEFIANAIYERVGVKAARSILFEMNEEFAIASVGVQDASPTYREEQRDHPDVQNGFVADAYLANWDVVGLNFDNIVLGKDGMYRIDNGGALTFRAQGGTKNFLSESIDELDTMRDIEYSSGQVFGALTEDELKSQAIDLVRRLHKSDL